MKNSQLKIRSFQFLKVEKDDNNINEVMSFCGVSEDDIEQELLYHYGGDSYLVTCNKSVHDVQNQYLLKIGNDIIVMDSDLFNSLFEVII